MTFKSSNISTDCTNCINAKCSLTKLIAEKLPVAIYSLTYNIPRNKICVNFVSENFEDVTKCAVELFKNYRDFAEMVTSDKRMFWNAFDKYASKAGSFVRQYEIRVPSGGCQELLDYCHYKYWDNGEVKYVGVIANRTNKKITDLALRMSEDRLAVALEGASAGLFDWIREKGNIIFCNTQALALCEINTCETTVWRCLRVIAPRFLKMCISSLRSVLDGKSTSFSLEFNLRDNEDRWLWVSGKAVSVDAANKRPLRIAGIIRDITISKQLIIERERMNEILEERIRERTAQLEEELATKLAAEQQLVENLRKEKELNDAKTTFVNMVSHEFRTPLAIIQGSVDLLGKYHERLSASERAECLSSVNKSIQRMTRTMDDIFILGKMKNNQLKFSPAEADVLVTFHSILENVEWLHGSKRIVFEVNQNVPPKLHLDEGLLYHIISNLVNNALKYSPSEKPVICNLNYRGGVLETYVEDFGIGIPEKDKANIFKLFHRGSNVKNKQGVGVGMFIVKYCVNLYRGSIAILSKDSGGTIFRVKLPTTRVDR
ncbi:MAG: PAS domain-containing sensor histidine kinase [Puniceicoccales bacterium]|nr:PAS domain-containing sensor histidine kinase [Puniceicoccales bacterium]